MRILIADDEPAVLRAVQTGLTLEGFDVSTAVDGRSALEKVATDEPDAVVLDWMMPLLDGIGVCRALRTAGDRVPVLLLTARGDVTDRVAGLDAGADDYLAKPFEMEELLARVRALLRRSLPDAPARFQCGDLVVDTETRTGQRRGRAIEFSRTEFSLLELLMECQGQVLTRELIMDRVWGTDFGPTSNSLAVYISYLRAKLESGGESRMIHTVHGVGYRMQPS